MPLKRAGRNRDCFEDDYNAFSKDHDASAETDIKKQRVRKESLAI